MMGQGIHDSEQLSDVRESTRSIRLTPAGTLVVHENGSDFYIDVSASEEFVRVGCTSISRKAFVEILRRVLTTSKRDGG